MPEPTFWGFMSIKIQESYAFRCFEAIIKLHYDVIELHVIYVVFFSGNGLFNGLCGVAQSTVADAFEITFDAQLL